MSMRRKRRHCEVDALPPCRNLAVGYWTWHHSGMTLFVCHTHKGVVSAKASYKSMLNHSTVAKHDEPT